MVDPARCRCSHPTDPAKQHHILHSLMDGVQEVYDREHEARDEVRALGGEPDTTPTDPGELDRLLSHADSLDKSSPVDELHEAVHVLLMFMCEINDRWKHVREERRILRGEPPEPSRNVEDLLAEHGL